MMGISYEKECDSWFERNKNAFDENNCSKETQIIAEFLKKIKSEIVIHNVLEIGCSYGYNLQHLYDTFEFRCYGIDLSEKAIEYGRLQYPSIELSVGGRKAYLTLTTPLI